MLLVLFRQFFSQEFMFFPFDYFGGISQFSSAE